MCGSIRKATSEGQALDYALAYAANYHRDENHPEGLRYLWTPVNPAEFRQSVAEFIEGYVPAQYRAGALKLLGKRPDTNLQTTLIYWDDVIY